MRKVVININTEYVSMTIAAERLGINWQTIQRWYWWKEDNTIAKPKELVDMLPEYGIFDKKNTKFFKASDLPKLIEFKKALNSEYRGAMAEYNRRFWTKPTIIKGTRRK